MSDAAVIEPEERVCRVLLVDHDVAIIAPESPGAIGEPLHAATDILREKRRVVEQRERRELVARADREPAEAGRDIRYDVVVLAARVVGDVAVVGDRAEIGTA